MSVSELHTDVVIVGAGAAGLVAALQCSPLNTLVLTKDAFSGAPASSYAQGGIAVAIGKDDSPTLHAQDTCDVAQGIGDPSIIEWVTRQGPGALHALLRLGANFDRDNTGGMALSLEAAHSRARVVHARGDATGRELMRTLKAAVVAAPHIELCEHANAVALWRVGDRIGGVWVQLPMGLVLIRAAAVVLATGGIGRLYRFTTNPSVSTGDGLAMAAKIGARLIDLEFVQFHPTALQVDADPLPLISEAIRGAGAILVNSRGQRFMAEHHPLLELAPRDVVSRAIWQQLQLGQQVYLDASTAIGVAFDEKFPTASAVCRRFNIDPAREPIPVTVAAHYHMGGVWVDHRGRTSVPGLWACGEAASTGVHGANRLASNSLLEALVFGQQVGRDVCGLAPHLTRVDGSLAHATVPSIQDESFLISQYQQQLRNLMWDRVGVVRSSDGLTAAIEAIDAIAQAAGDRDVALSHQCLVCRLVAQAALQRRESRGGHYRSDFPYVCDQFRRRMSVSLAAI